MTTLTKALDALDQACADAGAVFAEVRKNLDDWEVRFCERQGIKTIHIYPPIPDRRYDWSAYYDGHEEPGPCGYGKSRSDAIADLIFNHEKPGADDVP